MGRKVHITGISGSVGRCLAEALADEYDVSGYDLRAPRDLRAGITLGDLRNQAKIERALEGADTLIHLAADSSPHATWESALPHNIEGTYHVFEAARIAGVRRIVFASSCHVTGLYTDVTRLVDTSLPVAPGNVYGVSKVFGEALGRYYSHAFDLSVLCIRIGWFVDPEYLLEGVRGDGKIRPNIALWLSPGDCARLFRACIETPDLRFGIYYGISANTGAIWDIANAREDLGYDPSDDIMSLVRDTPDLAYLAEQPISGKP